MAAWLALSALCNLWRSLNLQGFQARHRIEASAGADEGSDSGSQQASSCRGVESWAARVGILGRDVAATLISRAQTQELPKR